MRRKVATRQLRTNFYQFTRCQRKDLKLQKTKAARYQCRHCKHILKPGRKSSLVDHIRVHKTSQTGARKGMFKIGLQWKPDRGEGRKSSFRNWGIHSSEHLSLILLNIRRLAQLYKDIAAHISRNGEKNSDAIMHQFLVFVVNHMTYDLRNLRRTRGTDACWPSSFLFLIPQLMNYNIRLPPFLCFNAPYLTRLIKIGDEKNGCLSSVGTSSIGEKSMQLFLNCHGIFLTDLHRFEKIN